MIEQVAVISILIVAALSAIVALVVRHRGFFARILADVFLGCLIGMTLSATIDLYDKVDNFFTAACEFGTNKRTWDVQAAFHALANANRRSPVDVVQHVLTPPVLTLAMGGLALLTSLSLYVRGRISGHRSQGKQLADIRIYAASTRECMNVDPRFTRTMRKRNVFLAITIGLSIGWLVGAGIASVIALIVSQFGSAVIWQWALWGGAICGGLAALVLAGLVLYEDHDSLIGVNLLKCEHCRHAWLASTLMHVPQLIRFTCPNCGNTGFPR